jgi:hypothetical protein
MIDQKRRTNGQFAPSFRGVSALPQDAPKPPVTVAERHAREEAGTVGYLSMAWGIDKDKIELGKRSAFQSPGFFEGQLKINGVDLVAVRLMYTPVAPKQSYRFEVALKWPGMFGKRLTDGEIAAIRDLKTND